MATRQSCRSPRSAATTAARDTGGSGCTATAVPAPPAAAAVAAASVGDGEGARSTAVGAVTTAAADGGGCCCCCCGGGGGGGGVAPRCDEGSLPPPDIDLGLGASALGAGAGVGREGAPPWLTVRAAWWRQTSVNDGRIKCGGKAVEAHDKASSRLLCLSPRAGASGLLLCMGGVKAGCGGGGGVNCRVTVLVTTLDPPAHSGGGGGATLV